MDFIKYTIWPAVKVRLTYWWWIVKYGGKKKIPPEVVFGALGKTVGSIGDNIMDAIRVSPEMDEEEQKLVRALVMKMSDLKREVENLNNKG
mgnify:CR=1 FL=1